MAHPGEPAQEYLTKDQTSGRCVACHVLSRDGTKMAVTYDGGDGAATMVDVGTTTVSASTTNWNFGTFTPDGSQFLSAFQGNIVVRNQADMSMITPMPSGSWATHPDLSPDGTRLVYVHHATPGADWSFTGGQIFTRSYDQTTYTFGAETPLVADANNSYYPSWSPDGQWIIFNQSPAGDAYNNANASVWVIKADGSQPAIQLANADLAAGGLTNSWARWAPFGQTLGAGVEPMFWITVSSKRDFGVRLFQVAQPQIWMTPFFPDRAAAGQDPSAPGFRLPFQNIESNNHIAQWTERVVVTE
jgi:Tol biopolymer transport system component